MIPAQSETHSPTACRTPHDHGEVSPRLLGSWELPGAPEAVAVTRGFLRTLLSGSPIIADALLLTSEVATNAIRHTRSRGRTFSTSVLDAGHGIRIEVTDMGGTDVPAVRDDIDAIDGRGLLLVAAIAARWGTYGDPTGRTTWFELTCDLPPARYLDPQPLTDLRGPASSSST